MEDAAAKGAETGEQNADQTASATETDWKAEADKWKALARKHEDQSKSNAQKATEYDRLAEANKSDQQRLEDRATTAEQRIAAMEAENLRMKVAVAKGVPADLVNRLQGTTQEELEADAELLTARLAQAAVPDLRAGAGQRTPGAEVAPDDWLRQLAGRG